MVERLSHSYAETGEESDKTMLDKIRADVFEDETNKPLTKITGEKVLSLRPGCTDRERAMVEAIHEYDMHHTSSLTTSKATFDQGLKVIQERRASKAQNDISKRIDYAKTLTKKRRDEAEAQNRHVSRKNFRDKTNVAALLQSASASVATATLAGVIAKKIYRALCAEGDDASR